jgi:Holliday junction resolvase RusA-like endonuclease
VDSLSFTVYCTPAPQGSKRGWIVKGKSGARDRAIVADANNKTMPYRQAITQTVLNKLGDTELPWAKVDKKGSRRLAVPVWLSLKFYLIRPPTAPRKRICPTVKPDIDKLIRSTMDALTGVLFDDDAQVVELSTSKNYGTPERVEIVCRRMSETMCPISDKASKCEVSSPF